MGPMRPKTWLANELATMLYDGDENQAKNASNEIFKKINEEANPVRI